MDVTPADERPHPPGPELRWAEWWDFDFVAGGGTLAGWCRLTSLPNLGVAWYHGFLVGPDRQLVAVLDLDVPLPGRSLEVRTTGLWTSFICETPLDHWTVGLETFGLGVDDPAELYGRQLGERVPLGFDLEWEARSAPEPSTAAPAGYHQPCRVHGEILVGSEEIDFGGSGRREHGWGPWPGWDERWFTGHGRLDDGAELVVTVVGTDVHGATGTIDGRAVDVSWLGRTLSGPGMPAEAKATMGGIDIRFDPVAVTPLEVADPEGRRTRAPRALCRITVSDGRTGWGWGEWNEPQD